MYKPDKPFWQMNIKELQEYVNKFKRTKKRKFYERKRLTIKKRYNKGKKIKIKLRQTRKNINETYG